MEALLNDLYLSQNKQTKNSKEKPHYHHQHQNQNQHHLTRLSPNIRRQTSCGAIHKKYAPSPHVQLEMVQLAGGVFLNHYPAKQFSLNSSLPPLAPTLQPHYYHQQKMMNHQQQQQQHPPLLPLPWVSKPAFRSLPPSPVPRKKTSKTKTTATTTTTTTATTTTTKMSRKPSQNMKKENKKVEIMAGETSKDTKTGMSEDDQVVGSDKGGPDPESAPKESETRVLRDADLNNNTCNNNSSEVTEVPSFFSLMSPPPSSLPLPKFTMRQNKLSCNAEAAADGVDSGATDNLRRMLKLR